MTIWRTADSASEGDIILKYMYDPAEPPGNPGDDADWLRDDLAVSLGSEA